MKYLPILFALLFASPAGAVCAWSTAWPACTVQYSDGTNLEDARGFFIVEDDPVLSTEGQHAVDRDHYAAGVDAIKFFDGVGDSWLVQASDVPGDNEVPVFKASNSLTFWKKALLNSLSVNVVNGWLCLGPSPWTACATGANQRWEIDVNGNITGWGEIRADTFTLPADGTFNSWMTFGDGSEDYFKFFSGLRVSENEDVFSQFGGDPTGVNPADATDMLVARKVRSVTGSGNRRAAFFIMDLDWTGTNAGGNNASMSGFVFTNEDADTGNTKTSLFGGGVGGRYIFNHRSSGTFSKGGGVSAATLVNGGDEDGFMEKAYAYLSEDGDGGAGPGGVGVDGIGEYYGFWHQASKGLVEEEYAIFIEDLNNANLLDAAPIKILNQSLSGAAIWLAADDVSPTGTTNGIAWGSNQTVRLYPFSGRLATANDFLVVDDAQLLFRDAAIGLYSQADSFLDIFANGAIRLGNSEAGAPTTYMAVEPTADTYWVGAGSGIPYGACQGMEIGWTQANAVQNQWYNISDADFVTTQLNEFTHDGNGQLTVLKDGMYSADWAGAFEADAAGVHIQITFSVNGTATDFGMNHFKTIAVFREFPIAAPTILNLEAGDTVNVALRTSDTGTPDLLVDHLLIRLAMLGGI